MDFECAKKRAYHVAAIKYMRTCNFDCESGAEHNVENYVAQEINKERHIWHIYEHFDGGFQQS